MRELWISIAIIHQTDGKGDKKMKKIVATLFLMTSFLSLADIILDSSNTKPAINEPFNIQVKFINEDKKDYKIEGIENLQILLKGTQSKYSYINGNKTNEKIDSYTVMANEIKTFPLSVSITGKNEMEIASTLEKKLYMKKTF